MTTVVALARDGAVHMAGDTMTNVYERPVPGAVRKVIRQQVGHHGEEALIGICGTGALANVIPWHLTVDAPDAERVTLERLQSWANAIATAITELCMDAHVTDEGKLDGTLMLGFRGCLWTISHQQAIPHLDGIAALGSGEGPAIGALDALLICDPPCDDADLVKEACRIAIERCRYSGGPVQVESVGVRG